MVQIHNQTRKIQIWNPADLVFANNGVTLPAKDPYLTIHSIGQAADLNTAINTSNTWNDSDSAIQVTTEQVAFENREIITNMYIGGRTLDIEHNVEANPNEILDIEQELRIRQSQLGSFAISCTFSDSNGVQRVEAFKEAILITFGFTPNGAGNYTVKLSFKITDSRKYVKTATGVTYRIV